ncbi:transposase [Candidatus Bipolaricaulota bacterium]|nr:transposase [Candidatus Bipolaricaulota bacterium]
MKLVTSDAHSGLKSAIAAELPGCCWQRCRTHFMRNLLTKVPKNSQGLVATLVRSIFAQPTNKEVWAQHERVCEELERRFPKAAEMLQDGFGGHLGVHHVPAVGVAPDLVQQPAGAAKPRDPAT